MKHDKLIGLLLAAALLASLPVSAMASGEDDMGVPPAADEGSFAPPPAAEDGEPADEIPEGAALGEEEAQDQQPPANAVTVDLTGAVETIHRAIYQGTEALVYFTDSTGTYYNQLDSAGNNEVVYVTRTDGIQTRLAPIANGAERAQMGFDLRLFLENSSDVTVEGATVLKNEMDVGSRCVDILLPDSGTVTVGVAAFGGAVPTRIPITFYNEDWENGVIVGGGSVISGPELESFDACWHADESGTVVSGGSFEVWTGPGYEIQVLEGGAIAETRAPGGAAAADVPAGSTCYVLHVDVDAAQFIAAAVPAGESYVPAMEAPAGTETEVIPETEATPEPETPPETETIPEPETPPETETETETAPEPETISAADVTVTLSGAVDKIDAITYLSPDGTLCYTVDGTGIHYNTPEGVVWLVQTAGIPTQFPVAPGTAMSVCTDAAYAVTADTAPGAEGQFHSFPLGSGELVSFRQTEILAPASGGMTVTVADAADTVPAQIPFTFYNEDWDGGVIVGGGSIGGPYAWAVGDTVISGGSFEVWTGPGYEIQVIEGGSVSETKAPYGPAAATVPEGSTCYVLQVDLGAEKFVIAAVKQGETFTPPDAATGPFKDVPDNSWFKEVIEKAYAAGVVNGITADTFSPNTPASRGQTVAMIWRQAGSPAGSGSTSFTDLTADYYRDAVDWASYVRAVNGTSRTSFEPGSLVTREQLAAILYRMAGSPPAYSGGLLSNWFDGGSVSGYARSAMQWALDYGIVNGYSDGSLHPQAAATRAEVCAMLMRYNELVGCFPTQPPAPTFEEQAVSQNVSHTERNLDNPKLIRPKRDKIDDGLYDNGEDGGQWIQQWSETYWDLDRSGEDIMWCTRNLTRMYTGPGVDYDVVYTLYSTYEVSRLGPDENGWTPVVYHEYETGSGFTGWDHTGYVRTDCLSKVVPCHPHVADFSSGPALEAWCHTGIPEGDLYADYGASANGTFYHEEYTPSISGDTYTYTLRGGGHVIIHNVLPEGLVSVEASGELETHSILLFVYLEKGYGIRASKGYGGGYSLSPSGDYLSCGIDYEVDMSTDEDIELTMFYGDGAPRVLQATIKDPMGGSRMGDGASRFMFLTEDGDLWSEFENFFNLKSGYKLKSLSPYATVGKVENNELHHFTVQNLPEGIDQIWFEVVRG